MRILINKKSICFCSHSDKISHRLEHVEYEKSFPTRSNMKEIEKYEINEKEEPAGETGSSFFDKI